MTLWRKTQILLSSSNLGKVVGSPPGQAFFSAIITTLSSVLQVWRPNSKDGLLWDWLYSKTFNSHFAKAQEQQHGQEKQSNADNKQLVCKIPSHLGVPNKLLLWGESLSSFASYQYLQLPQSLVPSVKRTKRDNSTSQFWHLSSWLANFPWVANAKNVHSHILCLCYNSLDSPKSHYPTHSEHYLGCLTYMQ